METIELKVFDEICRPTEIDKGNWIDLKAMKDIKLNIGQAEMIPLGVAMKLPEGYEAHIAPRSSTFKKYGIIQVNSVGVVDNSYSGPNDMWKMPVIKLAEGTEDIIHAGDRICQFRIIKSQPKLNFVDSTLENNADRGGFGSTGIK